MNNQIKIIQVNCRDCTKSRLSELKVLIRVRNPSMVFISETHWAPSFQPSFPSYHCFRKDSEGSNHWGGVAILVSNCFSMFPIKCSSSELLENVAISVSLASGENLTVVSSYCLKGNCRKEDITKLLGISSLYVIGGDFNAHRDLWDSSGPCNSVGRAIFSALNESDHACLLTLVILQLECARQTGLIRLLTSL